MENGKQVFNQLNTYNRNVNVDLFNHLETVNATNERIMLLMSHIINAHQIWIARINGIGSDIEVFDLRTFEDLKKQNLKNTEDTEGILAARSLDDIITYVNTKGQRFTNTIQDIFLHVFNHSTYHRAQINQLLVQEGKKPMVTDYIVYNRTEIF